MAGRAKRPEEMTPTEMNRAAGGDIPMTSGVGEKFDAFRARAKESVGNYFKHSLQGLRDADDKYRAFAGEHPLVDALPSALGAIGAGGTLPGLVGAGLTSAGPLGNKQVDEGDVSKLPPQGVGGGSPLALGTPVGKLPDAAQLKDPGLAPSAFGADALGGLGTDRGIIRAQQNQLDDHAGVQAKQEEAGAASLVRHGYEADLASTMANAKAHAARAEMKAVEDVDNEQLDHETKIQSAIDDTAAMGVDPGRYFKNRDIGFWTNMLIGSVASGILSAMNHQNNNPFIDSLRETVRTDINAQEKAIDQGWRRVKGMETAYERMRMRGADRITATIRMYDKTLESLSAEMQAKLAKATLPEVKANIELGLQALQLERDAMRVKMEEYWKTVRQQRAAAAAAAANAAYHRMLEQQKLNLETVKVMSQADKDRAEAEKARMEAGPGGSADKANAVFVPLKPDASGTATEGVIAGDPESKKKLEDATRNHEETMKAIQRIRQQRASAGGAYERGMGKYASPITPKWQREVKAETSALTAAVNHGAGLGAYDKGTEALLKERVGDLDSAGAAGDQLLDVLETQTQAKYDAFLHAAGGRPAVRFFDPKSGRSVVRETGQPAQTSTGTPISSLPGARKVQ